ncbi:FAD/NAD(P)-binding domain-containing protein [Fomes fomentarius]|nr:FAD/NAD(P)-binding domain-containing protein [Fomes fomentarius]
MTSTSTAQPRIVIIGGGPSGLVLLLTLFSRGINATLYERDVGFNARAHLGGTFDLGYQSGQRALRENGLEDLFKQYSRPEGEEFRLCDAAGNVLIYQPANENLDPVDTRPEIDRSTLRNILLDAVPSDSIKWGHTLASVRPLAANGQHELTFTNGTSVISDILVGADGANSRVRPLVSSAPLLYYNVNGAEISLAPEVAARPDMKDVSDAVGQGSVFVLANNKVLALQRNGDGRIRAYAWHSGPVEWTPPRDPSEARRVLLEIYKDWAPWMRRFIEHCDDEAIYHRPLFYLPVGHRWDHVPGVTVLGDAAHLMGPFAGAGANLAMVDGLELGIVIAEAITEGKTIIEREAAVAAWEEKMFVDAEKMAAITYKNYEAFVNPDAPASAVETIKSFILQPVVRRNA